MHSSDGKRSPGRLSRQGPPVLRWAVYEAGKTHARASAPDHAYYAQVKDRKDGKRAAISEARQIVRQARDLRAGSNELAAAGALPPRAALRFPPLGRHHYNVQPPLDPKGTAWESRVFPLTERDGRWEST